MNCATSVFAGVVVFAIIGNMSFLSGIEIDKVTDGGPGLAFVVFPETVAQMGGSQFWSFLFFFMLITLGLDTMFTNVETITTALIDHFKSLRDPKPVFSIGPFWDVKRKELVVVGTCFFSFIFGLSMVAKGGIYMFTLIDATCASWNILLFALLEVFLVAWMYGIDRLGNYSLPATRFVENLEEMGIKLSGPVRWYWVLCWQFITPLILLVLVVAQFAKGIQVSYDEYEFPEEINALGWLISLSSVAMLPLLAVRQIVRRSRKGKELGLALFKVTPKWKPQQGGFD